MGLLYSLMAVIVVVFFITVNLTVTALVVFAVLMVDFYLVATMY